MFLLVVSTIAGETKLLAMQTEIAGRVVGRIGNHPDGRGGRRRARAIEVPVAPDVAVDDQKASSPSSGSAFGNAAGGFSAPGLRRPVDAHTPLPAVAQRGDELVAKMRMVDHQFPEARSGQAFDVPHDQGLPPAISNGFGVWSVSGRMRSPRPAARIITFIAGGASEGVADLRVLVLEFVEQQEQRLEVDVARGGAAQMSHHARHVGQVAALAVAMAEPGEDAEHL